MVVNKNLKWKKRIDDGLLEMLHSGKADELYKTWLDHGNCKISHQFHQLQFDHIRNLFLMLPGGIMVGLLSTAILWLYNRLCKYDTTKNAQ